MPREALKNSSMDFEKSMKKYLSEAKNRLETEFTGTREAIKQLAQEKTNEYILFTEKYLDENDKELLISVFSASMYQVFCYGYGIGKIEGTTKSKVVL